mgnify:CR=1 FL=1
MTTKLEELKALMAEKQIASKAYKNGGGTFVSHLRNQEAHCMLVDAVLELLPQLIAVAEAAQCIRHWHDADNDGMVVSGEHVRILWDKLLPLTKETK